MTKLSTIVVDDVLLNDTVRTAAIPVPAGANKFSAQFGNTAAELGSALVGVMQWSIGQSPFANQAWSDFSTTVSLRSSSDYAANNVDIAADWLSFVVTTAGDGTASVGRLFVNFYSRPGGP